MLVGLVSDTHDRVDFLSTAIRLLREAGAEYFLHCGDLGSRRALEPFNGLAAGFVWGDQDRDRMGMLRYADSLQVQCFGILGDFELEDKHIAIVHGDDKKVVKRLLKEQRHDIILFGHEGAFSSEQHGKTLLICPGAVHGGSERTVALLDTATGKVQVIRLAD